MESLKQLFASPLSMIVVMFVIMWFLLIRPQQKKQKEHQAMLKNLKRGDRIVTAGGIVGVITGVTETDLTVEIADKVRVKVGRGFVSGMAQKSVAAESKEEKKA
jgi:preprotein translocase subunit YajC